jgi:hypothetical protein
MARNICGNGLGSVSLFLVAASFALSAPAMARDADDLFLPMAVTAPMTEAMAFVRPLPRPEVRAADTQVVRVRAATPAVVLVPQSVDRGRIRASWSIGVFR